MLSKKIISLGLAGLLSASLLVGCGNTEVKTKSSKPEQPKQEQKVVFDEVIADNEYIKMTLVGKEKNEYGAIALKVLVENKTDDGLLVSTENLQVNDIMNDPYWSCVVNAKAQAHSFIEWYVDSETNTNVKTVDDLKNIKGDLGVSVAIPGTSDEYEFKFRTQISILSDETVSKETTDKKEVVAEKPSSDKTDSKPEEKKAETKTASNEKKQTEPTDNTPKEDNNKTTQKKSNKNTTKEDKKEEPKQKGYYVTCPNGHKVWTVNGDYDCQQCYDDYMNQEDDKKNDTEKKDIYWCSECQCFSTYKHNHPVEMPVDNYEEPIQEEDTY